LDGSLSHMRISISKCLILVVCRIFLRDTNLTVIRLIQARHLYSENTTTIQFYEPLEFFNCRASEITRGKNSILTNEYGFYIHEQKFYTLLKSRKTNHSFGVINNAVYTSTYTFIGCMCINWTVSKNTRATLH